jgi:superfamily II DNA helicase RecQ
MQFANNVAEIIGSTSSIVYTDFIADIGPMVSALAECGVKAVGYHGEMDSTSRHESYLKWNSGQVQLIVATWHGH